MPAVPGFRQKVELAWGQNSGGLLTFGLSRFGGTDTFAASSWSAGFAGPYNDISRDVRTVAITGGRSDDMTAMRARTLTITGSDPIGLYNRKNPASPLAGLLLTDIPVRVTFYDSTGVAHPRFYGFVTTIEADVAGRGTFTITAVDFLDKLDRQNPIVAPAANLTDGQIIGAILDWFNWTDPALRSLCVGDTIAATYTRADGTLGGLALVSELMEAERGIVFVTAAGAIKYLDRNTRFSAVSAGSIDRVMTAFPVGTDANGITNAQAVQRTDMAGNPVGGLQEAIDSASIRRHGRVDASQINTPFLNADSQAQSLAVLIVLRSAQGFQPVYEIPINIVDAATQAQCMSRDLGDRVTMTIAPRGFGQFTSDFFIEGISELSAGSGSSPYTCTWRVSEVPASAPFRYGVSQLGSSDVFTY